MLAWFVCLSITAIAQSATIVGYQPGSDVQQHSLIDLDQQEMESHLSTSPPDFTAAYKIYTQGGNSGGYAECTVPPLAKALVSGATVSQAANSQAAGYVKSNAPIGATTVKVTYTSRCKSGGTSSPVTTGCFALGVLDVAGESISPTAIKDKYRTLAGFSTKAQARMAGQEYYAVYRAYYNHGDYGHRFVTAALTDSGIFAGKELIARVEGAKKGSAYQNVWMYVIREMEDAIMDCNNGCLNCNDDPVHAWDEAVAFYAGSLEGASGSNSGKLLYRLAERRCGNFGTCTGSAGKSAVNEKIVVQFEAGRDKLLQGKCVEAIPIKKRIVELMSVPLVQGAMRYAYKIDQGGATGDTFAKQKAEGAAFSAAILPRIAACSSTAAQLIRENMAMDTNTPMKSGFSEIKQTFESTFTCMGITCVDVGGVIQSGSAYYPLAAPCSDTALNIVFLNQTEETTKVPAWTIAVLVVVVIILFGMCAAAFMFRRSASRYQELADKLAKTKDPNACKAEAIGQNEQPVMAV
jgi:hypothetical protein